MASVKTRIGNVDLSNDIQKVAGSRLPDGIRGRAI